MFDEIDIAVAFGKNSLWLFNGISMLMILSLILSRGYLKDSWGVRLANVPTGLRQVVVLLTNRSKISYVHRCWSRSNLFASSCHVLHKLFRIKFELSTENCISILLAHKGSLSSCRCWFFCFQCSIRTWTWCLRCLALLKFSKRGCIKSCLNHIKSKIKLTALLLLLIST